MTIKQRIHTIIFESNTQVGKMFDIALILTIVASVVVVMLDSIQPLKAVYGNLFNMAEWLVTILFTAEFVLRLYSARHPKKYVKSFFGIVDILSIAPTYISLFVPGTQFLTVIRILRVLRIFRILKLVQYVQEAQVLVKSVQQSGRKIVVFIASVFLIAIILGSLMYVIEGEANGYTSIPKSVYWAVVTLTTVGYGDISPQTNLGQAIATFIMILGYSIIVVPTGVVSSEFIKQEPSKSEPNCPTCGKS
jgi:voltage-gated potassium channel